MKKIIFFTGLDRAGKTSVRKYFSKLTNQKHITFDRSFIDNIVFDEIERNIHYTSEEINNYLQRFYLLKNVYIIFMSLNYEEINHRAKRTESIVYDIEKLQKTQDRFEKYLKLSEKMGMNIIRINCDNKSIVEISNEINKKIGDN